MLTGFFRRHIMECEHHGIKATLKKLWPSFLVLGVGALAGFTNTLGETVRETVRRGIEQFTSSLTPYVVNFIILVVAINIAYVLYHPACHYLQKWVGKTKMEARSKEITFKVFKPLYWLVTLYVVLTLFAPDVMGKLTVGIGLFGAAIAVVLKDTFADIIAYGRMGYWQNVKVGDNIQVLGLADVKGRVIEVDYFQTRIEGPNGIDSIANRDLQAKGVRHLKEPVTQDATPAS